MRIIILIIAMILLLGTILGTTYFTSLIVGIPFLLSLKTGIIWVMVMAFFNFALKGISSQLKKH